MPFSMFVAQCLNCRPSKSVRTSHQRMGRYRTSAYGPQCSSGLGRIFVYEDFMLPNPLDLLELITSPLKRSMHRRRNSESKVEALAVPFCKKSKHSLRIGHTNAACSARCLPAAVVAAAEHDVRCLRCTPHSLVERANQGRERHTAP